MAEKEVKKEAVPQLPQSLEELTAMKKEIEELLRSLEDEYGRAQISDSTYNEIKSKNKQKLAAIEAEISKLTSQEPTESTQPNLTVTQPQPSQPTSQSTPQAAPQTVIKAVAIPDLSKFTSELNEIKKKLDTEIGKINVELEKIKTLLDAQKDLRAGTEEKIQRLTENVGELRSMMFQKESEIDKMQVKVQRMEEVINEIKPEQYSKELQKRDKDLASKELRIEKLEKISSDMVKDVNDIRTVFKEIGSVENLVNLSKRISEKVVKMDNMVKDVERISQKLEKLYVDVSKRLEEFDEYKSKQVQTDGLAKDLMKAVDDINVRLGKFVATEDFMKLKTLFDSFTKDLEDVKKSVSSGIPFLGPLPEEIQQLQKQREEITTLIKTIDQQYKAREIKEEDYKKVKEANLQKMAEIDKKIKESIDKIKGIPEASQLAPQPVIQPQQPVKETPEDKSAKLLADLKDLYKKGLISEKAYQKTSRLLLK